MRGVAGPPPSTDVVRGTRDAVALDTIPNRELLGGRVEIAGTVDGMAHCDQPCIAEELVVVDQGGVGREDDGVGLGEAASEAI